jgi:nitroimidazol reductase NimA-like FMN-containing flavoprotein (pyridoxamine 5'-phosphate oxidase superfamily)
VPYISRALLSLSKAEADEFLHANRWGRLATASLAGEPHVTPLGYVYHRGAIYFHALRRSRRGLQLAENPTVAFLVDDGLAPGDPYTQRRGVIVYGRCVTADNDTMLDAVRQAYMRAMKAASLEEVQRRTHSWYRIDIDRLASWDFRKIPSGADRKA